MNGFKCPPKTIIAVRYFDNWCPPKQFWIFDLLDFTENGTETKY